MESSGSPLDNNLYHPHLPLCTMSEDTYDRQINVEVGGIIIPLGIQNDEEQALRSAATLVNQVRSVYETVFRSDDTVGEAEIWRYTALHIARELETLRLKGETSAEINQRLAQLKENLSKANL